MVELTYAVLHPSSQGNTLGFDTVEDKYQYRDMYKRLGVLASCLAARHERGIVRQVFLTRVLL